MDHSTFEIRNEIMIAKLLIEDGLVEDGAERLLAALQRISKHKEGDRLAYESIPGILNLCKQLPVEKKKEVIQLLIGMYDDR